MSQADTHHGYPAYQLLHVGHQIVQQLGVSRTRRKKDTGRLHREHVFGGHCGRHGGDMTTSLAQQAQNVVFQSAIGNQYPVFGRAGLQRRFVPCVVVIGGNRAHEVDIVVTGGFGQAFQRQVGGFRGDDARHNAAIAKPPGYGPGVHPADAGYILGLEKFVKSLIRLGMAGLIAVLPDYQSGHLDPARLEVLPVDTVIAHQRIS